MANLKVGRASLCRSKSGLDPFSSITNQLRQRQASDTVWQCALLGHLRLRVRLRRLRSLRLVNPQEPGLIHSAAIVSRQAVCTGLDNPLRILDLQGDCLEQSSTTAAGTAAPTERHTREACTEVVNEWVAANQGCRNSRLIQSLS